MIDGTIPFQSSDVGYIPAAIYFCDADSIEYVRTDAPCIHRRIDSTLTLILSMENRSIIGFKIKGFRHFYLRMQSKCKIETYGDFIETTKILEEALSVIGNAIFNQQSIRIAYEEALQIAATDRVQLRRPTNIAC